MKKKVISFLLPAMLASMMIAGCGKDTSGASGVQFESIGGDANSESADTVNADGESGNAESAGNSENAGSAENAGSGVEGAGAGEQSGNLYEDFLAGKAKAKFTGEADLASYITLGNVLTKGESYTLDEIIKNGEKGDGFEAYTYTGSESHRYIDCGKDGNQELLVELGFGEEFTLDMVIKDMGGELNIIYSRDQWSRSNLEIADDGTIESSGSGGATIHGVDKSYIDAAGKYHFFYGSEEYGSPYSYYAYKNGDYVVLDFEGLNAEQFMVISYWTSEEENRDYYYTLCELDPNYNICYTEDLYMDSNPFKQKFDEAGIQVYTVDDVEKMLKDRASQIGYPIAADFSLK